MSRRYGRNQKRVARQRIAELEVAVAMCQRELVNTGDALADAREELRDVAVALGRDFIGLRPGAIAMTAREFARVQDAGSFRAVIGDSVATMCLLNSDVIRDPGFATHVHISIGGRKVGYAISLAALHYTPAGLLARRIANEVGHRLVADLRAAAAAKDC